MKISARNQMRGVVDHVHIGDVMTELGVRLAGGDIVVSAITTDSARRLGIGEGKSVTVIVKSTEVMLGVD
jgi:molybdate transport system regulatory protein